MGLVEDPYYRGDLALVHHRGFGFHAQACAPGIIALLQPVRLRGGIVLELGCGSGLLTRELSAAGHRVIATDASPAMLELARTYAPDAEDFRRLALPEDPLPPADAVVSVGHVLNYLPDEPALDQALTAAARALRPGGLLALDICDLAYGQARDGAPPFARLAEDWAIITRFSLPAPKRFVRQITTFVRNGDGSWRRDDETHYNVLVDTARLPSLLAAQGIQATVASAFGTEQLPTGLRVVIGQRPWRSSQQPRPGARPIAEPGAVGQGAADRMGGADAATIGGDRRDPGDRHQAAGLQRPRKPCFTMTGRRPGLATGSPGRAPCLVERARTGP